MIRLNKNPKAKKCWVCGRPVFSVHSMFCRGCSGLDFRMKARRFPPEAQEEIWDYLRANDRKCYFSQLPLELDDTTSPWYCVFDHLTPLDPTKIVLTCALINEMKSALSEREFWFYVEQLADFITKGTKIKKIKLSYWRQHVFNNIRVGGHTDDKFIGARPKPGGKRCDLCHRPVFNVRSKYCRRCSHFAHRLEMQRFGFKTVQEILDHVRTRDFTCFYTGLPLDMTNPRSPWYCVFNFLTPGDHSKVVLTFALFNEMKSDLSINEFWYYIRQLANYKRNHSQIRKKRLVYWNRLNP